MSLLEAPRVDARYHGGHLFVEAPRPIHFPSEESLA